MVIVPFRTSLPLPTLLHHLFHLSISSFVPSVVQTCTTLLITHSLSALNAKFHNPAIIPPIVPTSHLPFTMTLLTMSIPCDWSGFNLTKGIETVLCYVLHQLTQSCWDKCYNHWLGYVTRRRLSKDKSYSKGKRWLKTSFSKFRFQWGVQVDIV